MEKIQEEANVMVKILKGLDEGVKRGIKKQEEFKVPDTQSRHQLYYSKVPENVKR